MPSLLYSNIFHILNLPISPYHYMKEPYFVISVKDMGEKTTLFAFVLCWIPFGLVTV